MEDRQHVVAFGALERALWRCGRTSDHKLEMNIEILEPTEVVTSNHLCLSRTKGSRERSLMTAISKEPLRALYKKVSQLSPSADPGSADPFCQNRTALSPQLPSLLPCLRSRLKSSQRVGVAAAEEKGGGWQPPATGDLMQGRVRRSRLRLTP